MKIFRKKAETAASTINRNKIQNWINNLGRIITETDSAIDLLALRSRNACKTGMTI
jgi:hypothetical protein